MQHPNDPVGALAKNVRVGRKKLGMSQEELAHRVGIDVRYLGGIERKQENPSLKVIDAIAIALNTSVAELFIYTNDNKD